MLEKIDHSKKLISDAVEEFGDNIAVAVSWGKDSMALLHLALQVKKDIPIFSVLTIYKPRETFDFAIDVCKKYNIKPKIYMVGGRGWPQIQELGVTLLSPDNFIKETKKARDPLYKKNPDLCCEILKVCPMKKAYRDLKLKAWFSGLRNTEGTTRQFLNEIEQRGDKEVKINPILTWTEEEVWQYLEENGIPVHPWYKKRFPDGKRIRSLGCEPCTVPIYDDQSERMGRWSKTFKMAGECGIHTKPIGE